MSKIGVSLIPGEALLEGVASLGGKIIDKIWPDKAAQEAERAKAQLALLELQSSSELRLLQTQLSAIISESQSQDPWTSRARPSFMYVIYVMILASIPMGVLFAFNPTVADGIVIGMGKWLKAIPEELYMLFGAGYLGYSHYRSADKKLGR